MQLQLRSSHTDADTKALMGKTPRPSDMLVQVTGNASVFKPDGRRLLTLRRGALDPKEVQAAHDFMHLLKDVTTTNRGNYAGEERDNRRPGVKTGSRTIPIKRDGSISRTPQSAPVRSVVIGAFDRSPRIPFCRQTQYSTKYPEEWRRALPFVKSVGDLFKEVVPDRYAAQLEQAHKTHPAYVLPGTPFTTITVNNTVTGAYHTDKGDYGPGFGVIVCMRRGYYRGAELVFAKYGAGVDLQHGDAIFFDPHEVHGNVPMVDAQGRPGIDHERITMVFYYRSRMVECLEPTKELERAKTVRGALRGDDDGEA